MGLGGSPDERKGELLQVLREVVESVDLTIDIDELFTRVLEIALGVTGAEGGSLMLLDPERGELRVKVAAGIEPELWPKIRVRIGEGIAGRVAADARPLRLRGKADRQAFRIVRERLDVESALCVPLVHDGRVLGVLNLHHRSQPDAFDEADLSFAPRTGRSRRADHRARTSSTRTCAAATLYTALREVREPSAVMRRSRIACPPCAGWCARHVGGGIARSTCTIRTKTRCAAPPLRSQPSSLLAELRVGIGDGLDGGVAESGEAALLRRPTACSPTPRCRCSRWTRWWGALRAAGAAAGPNRSSMPPREMAAVAAEEIAKAEREARTMHRATKIGAINEADSRWCRHRSERGAAAGHLCPPP